MFVLYGDGNYYFNADKFTNIILAVKVARHKCMWLDICYEISRLPNQLRFLRQKPINLVGKVNELLRCVIVSV